MAHRIPQMPGAALGVSLAAMFAHQARNCGPKREREYTRGRRDGASPRRPGGQCAPERFNVTTPATIRATPTT
ncbi:hypothetical protein, partial [Mycobacterium sp. E2462]|uniref:hypothetical protein n=1 Tax=Mycobacterium sp. E2462 TaxID=1834133 RepID=UPI001E58658F